MLEVKLVEIDLLKSHPNNARTHSKKQLKMIASSISKFGFVSPVIATLDNVIIAGHGRVEAARIAGLTNVPVVHFAHNDPDMIRAYMLADNQLAVKAGWDFDMLIDELHHMQSVEFDVEDLGFEVPELDLLFERDSARKADPGPEDKVPPASEGPAVSQIGDVWLLGPHRLVVGNSLEADAYSALMLKDKAAMILTDPPYNVPITGNVSGLGKKIHGDFAFASGEMTSGEFTGFLKTFLQHSILHASNGALSYVFMDWRHMTELLAAATAVALTQLNLCVWNKTNAGMGSFYRSQHELCFIFKQGDAAHRNNVELGKHGRSRSNVWTYAGVNTFRKDRDEELNAHPTVKPVAMIADAIRDASKIG
ncbi:MAG: hypothetical protein RLZZ444_171, partial [Pseudomonadota bacterium]